MGRLNMFESMRQPRNLSSKLSKMGKRVMWSMYGLWQQTHFVVNSTVVRLQTRCVYVGRSRMSKPTKFLMHSYLQSLKCENFETVLDAKILLGLVFSRDNYNCSSCEDFHTKFWY